jgi:hypothetical protein
LLVAHRASSATPAPAATPESTPTASKATVASAKIKKQGNLLNLIGMEQGTFHPPVLFGSDFISRILIKNFKTFFEVKIDINQIYLTPSAKLIEPYEKCS